MTRLLAPLILCAVVALAAASAASPAQTVTRPPERLWDTFPLESSPSPSSVGRQPIAQRPRAVPAEDSNGVSPAALVALLLGAAGMGAAAYTAVSSLRARRRGAAPQPGRRTEPESAAPPPQSAEPKAATATPGLRFARARAPTSETEPAAIGSQRSAAPVRNGTQPAAAPAAPAARAGRLAPEREPPAARPEPAPPITAPPEPGASPSARDTCQVKLHSHSTNAHFFAVPSEGGPVLARSPDFKIGRAAGDSGLSAREALRALVDELTAAGWRQSGAGRTLWDLRFERSVPEHRPVTPESSG